MSATARLQRTNSAAATALFVLVILAIFAARIRLLDAPLERDEGEYGYMGQLLLQGSAPYAVAANMKFPGVSAVYAVFMTIYGQSAAGIHMALLIVNALTAWLVYLLGRRLFHPAAGAAAAATFMVLSSGWSVMGMWSHATHFVMLPATGALLLLLQWEETGGWKRLAWSGLLFGVSVLMKQHGLFFVLFGGVYVAVKGDRRQLARSLGVFVLGAALPFLLMSAALWKAGVFGRFWFWTFQYARLYTTAVPVSAGLRNLAESTAYITLANRAAWVAAAGGAAFAYYRRQWMLLGFALAAFLAVCPGFYFREHYFLLLVPAAGLFAGALTTLGRRGEPSPWTLYGLAGVLLFCVTQQREFLFAADPVTVTAAVYGANPFPEAAEVARYLRANVPPETPIVVLGSEPEIY